MENDYRKEARKQYLKYFRIWFIVVAVLVAVYAGTVVSSRLDSGTRGNNKAPEERVYDEADVLTASEEERLRDQIAKAEKRLHMDIVIVTCSVPLEGPEAIENLPYSRLEDNMEAMADDFWDENEYGYNKSYEGDGLLLLQNWYEGQRYVHISTSGAAERRLSSYDIDRLIDAVAKYYATDPYRAYEAFLDATVSTLNSGSSMINMIFPWWLVIILPVIVSAIYAGMNMSQSKTKDTTAVNAYVAGGKPVLRVQRDDFIRKHVTKRHIERSSSGGGGGHSGGGGHHHSRSGASHGGGGRRLR